MLVFVLVVLWMAAAGSALVSGLDYYALPLAERAYSPLAPLWAPSGLIGQGLGIVGTLLILIGVVGYSARKRFSFLARAGSLKHWLDVHIFLCTLGPFFVLLHTTFKFGGIVSIAFWSMAIVVASGIFGRYVYARIPKTVNGRFLGLADIEARIEELAGHLAGLGLPASALEPALALPALDRRRGLAGSLALALREDFAGRARMRRVRRLLGARTVSGDAQARLLDLSREQVRLRQQVLVLAPFQRLFRYWHVVHLPLAIVMLLVLTVHVAVAVAFGYTWIF